MVDRYITSYSKGRKTLGLRSFVANYSQAFMRPLVRRYMAKEAMRFILTISLLFLAGCANLKYEPEDSLVKIEVQKLVPTEDCSGKGIRAYSVKGSNKRHLLDKEIFYVSPGNWEIAYYPTYEELIDGVCEEMEMLIIHGEYTISYEFKQGFSYFIYLNKEREAGIKQNAI